MKQALQTNFPASEANLKVGIAGGLAAVLIPSIIFLLCQAEEFGIFVLAVQLVCFLRSFLLQFLKFGHIPQQFCFRATLSVAIQE